MSHDNEIKNDILLKRSTLKVYVYAYKSEHPFKRYPEIKDLFTENSEKKKLKKIFKKTKSTFEKNRLEVFLKSFPSISVPNFEAVKLLRLSGARYQTDRQIYRHTSLFYNINQYR